MEDSFLPSPSSSYDAATFKQSLQLSREGTVVIVKYALSVGCKCNQCWLQIY